MTSTVVRRLVAAGSVVSLVAAMIIGTAVSASADTPEPLPGNWQPKPDVDVLHAFLLLGGVPVLVFVVVTLLFVAPALARGADLSINALEPENQWLGGPSKGADELAAPDTADSRAGGAGGSW